MKMDYAIKIIEYIICIGLGVFIGREIEYSRTSKPTRPVEEIVPIDSFIKVNDSLKVKVEKLDSIKNAKIIEVQTVDNDSSVKLFYQLIRK